MEKWNIVPHQLKVAGVVLKIEFKGTFLQAVEFSRLICGSADITKIE